MGRHALPRVTRSCAQCSGSFLAPRRARVQLYCSRPCQRDAMRGAVPGLGVVMAYCAPCGSVFTPSRNRENYCSTACAHLGRVQQVKALGLIRGRVIPPPRPAPVCERCGEVVGGHRRICDACLAPRYIARPSRMVSCAVCGGDMEARQGPAIRYCSMRCRRKTPAYIAGRALRRARHAGVDQERVYRAVVYQRDDWTCQLCGLGVDRGAVAPEWMSPTLDHRIPLAKGGSHTYDNLQLAHFICNSRKGDRVGHRGAFSSKGPGTSRTARQPRNHGVDIPTQKAMR